MTRLYTSRWIVLSLFALGLSAGSVSAALLIGTAGIFTAGVDVNGNPNFDAQHSFGITAKIYKETTTQKIYLTGKGPCKNDYGFRVVFKNLGATITDPFTGGNRNAISTQDLISANAANGFATDTLTATF